MNYKAHIKSIRNLLVLFFAITTQSTVAQQLHAVKDNIACLWGLKNDSGKWVIPPKYTRMDKNWGNFFISVYNEKWGVISTEGKITLPFEYDNLRPDSYLNGSNDSGFYKIYAFKNGKAGVIDINGNVKIPFLYDAVWKELYTDLFHTTINKKLGLRDYEKELLPCKYTTLSKIEDCNLFVAGTSDTTFNPYYPFSGKNVGIINLKGDTIVPFRFKEFRIPQRTYPDHNSYNKYFTPRLGPLIVAVTNEGMGLYTFEGKCLLEPRYNVLAPRVNYDAEITYRPYDYRNDANIYTNEPLTFTENDKYGIVYPGIGLIQPAVYESIVLQVAPGKRPAILSVSKNGKHGLLNADGTLLLDCDYETIYFYCGRVFVSEKEGRIREYNLRKKEFEPRIYSKIFPVSNSHILLVSNEGIYTNLKDTAIHPCKVLAHLPGDITILDDYSAIEGKGSTAERVEVQRLGYSTINYLSLNTKSGVLLCDIKYNVLIHSNKYGYIDNMNWTPRIIVSTKTQKKGIIDSKGKLVVDTIFETIKEFPLHGRLFVKPLQPKRDEEYEYSPKGWAIADSTGKLLTKPEIIMQEFNIYYPCMFLRTENGAGVFDFEKGKFIIPASYKNGFVTGNGDILMQTKNRLFDLYSNDGKKLSPQSWKGLIHVSGEMHSENYANGFSKKDLSPPIEKTKPDSKRNTGSESRQLEDEWLMVNGDTLAILSKGKLIYNKRAVLNHLYDCFLEANENDISDSYDNYFGPKAHLYSNDCPRIEAESVSKRYYSYYTITPSKADPSAKVAPKNQDSVAINDSLVMHMIREIAPKARYILHPRKEVAEDGERQELYHDRSSYYYRVIYRNPNLISLQVLDNYGYQGASINKHNFNRSVFNNYMITKSGWKQLKLAQLFKPGYETFLNAEIVTAIQKADTLEMNCNNPASYLQQCEGRFSFSKEGLWLYLKGDNGYEFIPQLIPWLRIKSIIPNYSAAFVFLKT